MGDRAMKMFRLLFLWPVLAFSQTWYNQTDVISSNSIALTNKTVDCNLNTCLNVPSGGLTAIGAYSLLGNNTGVSATPTGTGSAAMAVFDVRAYGAKCDGTTDDTTAWQNAWNALVAATFQTGTPLAAKLVGCGTGQSLITSTLNWTNLSSFNGQPYAIGVTIDMTGTCLIGKTSGTPVIDALSTRYINWEHLCIHGSSSNSPNIGLMIGRKIAANGADVQYFNRPVIEGYYTLSSWVNFGSEDITLIEPTLWNSYASGTVYAMIQDGANHFNACSLTVATGCTLPTDTNQSFGNNIVFGGWIGQTPSNGFPYWESAAQHHQFYGGYMSTSGANCAQLYSIGTLPINNLYFDLHCETNAETDTFLITGTNATPVYGSFYFNDRLSDASNSVLKLDSGVTSAICDDCQIHITQFNQGAGVKLFDNSANWKYSGTIYVQATGNYTAPSQFSGTLCIANNCDNYKNPGSQFNTGAGNGALTGVTSGTNSTAFGNSACHAITTNNQCVAFGGNAGSSATATAAIAAFGYDAGQFVTTGLANVAVGNLALTGIAGTKLTGNNNTALGASALTLAQGSANGNTGVGSTAGAAVTTGASNTIIGDHTAGTLATGSGNILIGVDSTTDTAASGTANTLQIRGLSPGIATIAATGTNTAAPLISEPAHVNVGTKFTVTGTGACSSTSTALGGASAGSFLCTGTAGASTATITIAGATGNTSNTGWACVGGDATSGVAWSPSGAASTTTGTMAGTIATTSDRVVFTCTGY